MPQVINTNIQSLNAQRNLNTSQTALAVSLQRLSSGLRINSAKDDAAGLAISERFTTQIRGLNQATRNANDGISLAQTGEGALAEISNNLQRIRELAVQSVNATNSNSDRAALDAEVQQRLAEINRISAQTSFNGQKILDGSFGNAVFQVGANVAETISLSLQTSTRTNAIGSVATATSVDLDTLISAGSPAVTGSPATYFINATAAIADYTNTPAVATTSTQLGAVTTSAVSNAAGQTFRITIDGIDVINSTQVGGTAVTINTATLQAAFTAFDTAQAGYTISGTLAGGNLVVSKADGTDMAVTAANTFNTPGTITGLAGFTTTHTTGTPLVNNNRSFTITDPAGGAPITVNLTGNITSVNDLVVAINGAAGGAFTASVGANNTLTLTDATSTTGSFGVNWNGLLTGGTSIAQVPDQALVPASSVTVNNNFSIAVGTGTAVAVANGTYTTAQSLVDAISTALGSNASVSLDANNVATIVSGEGFTVSGIQGLAVFNGGTYAVDTAQTLATANVLTVAASNTTLQKVDSALTSVNSLRSNFGAIQNRFDSVIANLQTTTENLTASRSRILDADFAQETAALTRAQILQQAGVAMLAQANALPQNVLSLLRG